jgi:hypothetical protein
MSTSSPTPELPVDVAPRPVRACVVSILLMFYVQPAHVCARTTASVRTHKQPMDG